jgi:hypothetical protein
MDRKSTRRERDIPSQKITEGIKRRGRRRCNIRNAQHAKEGQNKGSLIEEAQGQRGGGGHQAPKLGRSEDRFERRSRGRIFLQGRKGKKELRVRKERAKDAS